jgi:hypothetical protein
MFGRGRGRGRKPAVQPVYVPVPVLVEDVWVQCDNPDCKKWRKLPPGSKPPPEDVEWCVGMGANEIANAARACALCCCTHSAHSLTPLLVPPITQHPPKQNETKKGSAP